MKKKMTLRAAIQHVNHHGMLLVFPMNGKAEPHSLWSVFFPKSKMRWEWDDNGDTRVADLWHLRAELSESGQVIYCKWYRGRATLISRELFVALLSRFRRAPAFSDLTFQARDLLDLLNEDSPLSTKALKRASDLQGRDNEKAYTAALKVLWSRLLIVAWGEVDEGAFPSLAIGSTQNIFEDLWSESLVLKPKDADRLIGRLLPEGSLFAKYLREVEKGLGR